MKKLVSLLALVITFLATTTSGAEEPYLELIRALRQKNYGDLALDYMDRLTADKSVPADVKAVFPLERARVRIDQAAHTFNIGKRLGLYAQARMEFDNFIKTRPNDPYVVEARFESARILALQGRGQLQRAQKADEGAKTGEFQKAFETLVQASRELKAALAQVEEGLKKNPQGMVAKGLTQAKFDCNLEMNINLLDRAACYEELNKNREEAAGLIKDAITELKKLHAQDPKNPICWVARAWAGKGFLDLDTPAEAKKEFEAVLTEPDGPHVEAAKRLVRFFQFHDLVHPLSPRQKPSEARTIGEEWVKQNPGHLNTAEGIYIRYELAKMYENEGRGLMKDPKGPPDAKAKVPLEKARTLYSALDDIDSEFSDDIQRRKLGITSLLFGTVDPTKDLAQVDTFDKAFDLQTGLAAQLANAEDKDRKKILEAILKVLNRALDLADEKVPPSKVAEVRSNLAYVYMATADLPKAVVIGEDVARRWPHVSKAAAGGAYALQAYSIMINEGTANAAEANWIQSDYDRMLDLVKYMEKTWPTDRNTDAARHQVGTLLLRQKKAREAAEFLSRVSDGYQPDVARTDARWWWAVAAQQMLSENITEAEKKNYQQQALKALEGIPEVNNEAHQDIAQIYVASRLQIGQIYYEAKQYDKLDALANHLQKRLPNFKRLDDNYKKDLKRTVDALSYYAQYGRATQELNAGRAAEARKLADPILQKVSAQVKESRDEQKKVREEHEAAKDEKKKEELRERLDRLTRNLARDTALERGLMIVALRAAIQDDNLARANQLLTSLQAMQAATKDDKEGNVSTSIYVQIVAEMHRQVKELKEGLPKTQPILDKTIKSFAAFLDQLSAKVVGEKQPAAEMIFFLANAYSSIGKHGDAGKLLGKIPDPGDTKDDKAKTLFRQAQLMSLKELRLGKQFEEAYKLLLKIRQSDWGSRSFQVDEEAAALYEDWGKFAAATKAWSEMIAKILRDPKALLNPKTKEQYYEAYYKYVYCLTKHALTQPAGKQTEFLTRAAKAMAKVAVTQPDFGKEGLKEKYTELLNSTPELKKLYEVEYAAAKKAADEAAAANQK